MNARRFLHSTGLALALGLAPLAAGCTSSDGDRIEVRISESARAEIGEAHEQGLEALVQAIRAAIDGGAVSGVEFAVDALEVTTAEGETLTISGALTLTFADGTAATIDGELEVEREGEAHIEVLVTGVTIASGDFTTLGATITGGGVTLLTEAHIEYGGGRGGHAHGGEEEEEAHGEGEEHAHGEGETAFSISLDVFLPTGPGALGILGYQGASEPFPLEEEAPEVPAPVT